MADGLRSPTGASATAGHRPPGPPGEGKVRAAALSVISNSILILAKVIAGTVTGSVAILTEAVHSSIDLVASMVAFLSVRKAVEPADESHRYGHEKIENLAAAIEAILILVGSAAIAFEAIRHLVQTSHVKSVGLGVAVVGLSMAVNLVVSSAIGRKARSTDSAALTGDAAHLRTDALTSGAVLIGLILVKVTGAQWLDPAVALAVAAAIVVTGVRLLSRSSRVLVDEALPAEEVAAIRRTVEVFATRGVVGYHELRTRPPAPGAMWTCTCSSPPEPRWRARIAPPTSSRTASAPGCTGPTCSSTSSPRTGCVPARCSRRRPSTRRPADGPATGRDAR